MKQHRSCGENFRKRQISQGAGADSEHSEKAFSCRSLAIAEEFQISPKECIYCGDTNTDMDTGKAAGMFTIGVTWGFRPRKELEENHAENRGSSR